ncbi:hypothetical protein B0H15DRAFT_952760 [Mycena belliarum]|uniref:ribonuclease H n=1 Tax=Mycena belliarum TaxID=1033014 RepID=A0AAD6XJ09_9AGAR|nr:hypothetical protein B0H15DRAFT_952760 [Mycena belliae]
MSRHPTLYFADGTLTLKASDGTLYNVYQHHLIMQSDFFSGMLTLPIPNHPPISLTDNTKDWIQKARDAGLDGTSDATAVQLPDKFTNIDCERFLEFVFNTKGWTARVPDLDVLCSILKTSHFFAAESGVEYAIHHLENHEGLAAALRFKMGCDYHLTEWITQAFDELMSTSIKDMTAEDEQLIGQRAYRAIARAQAAVQDHRVTLAVCPPPPSHTNWFRIFTKGNPRNLRAKAPDTQLMPNPNAATTTAYTDGSALHNGQDNAQAGAGVYFGDQDPRNISLRIPSIIGQSNNTGEIIAVKEALEACPTDVPLRILSDSKLAVDGLTKNLKKWEDGGFFEVSNGPAFRRVVTNLRRRKAKTSFKWVKGHNGEKGNEEADRLAGEGSAKPVPDQIDIKPNPALMLPGAKLQWLTQSKAYKIIRQIKRSKPEYREKMNRRATRINMEYAKAAVADLNDDTPPDSLIWKSIRHPDVSRNIRYFLWMLLHGAYKVGRYWEKIKGHERWATCSRCGVLETAEHILTQCEIPGQKEIWELANELWKLKTGDDLSTPTLGQITSCAAVKIGRDKGATRLFRIMISESSHLIWRLRCERVIRQKPHATNREIRNRWLKAINNRLGIDCALTDKKKYGKKALKKSLVRKTWAKVLKNEEYLPEDWMREAGVLVGIG